MAVAAHLTVGLAARRRVSELPLVPMLNLLMMSGVLVYWAQRWHGYLTRGITWYLTDQWMPLYALLACLLGGLTLAGRMSVTWPNWMVFGINATVALGAAILFTTFRMNRLF